MRHSLLPLLLVGTILSAGDSFAAAETVRGKVIVPVESEIQIHPCTGEEIEMSGFDRLIAHGTFDNTGEAHSVIDFQIVRTGVGLETGTEYRLTSSDRLHINGGPPEEGQTVFHDRVKVLLTAPGSGPAIHTTAVAHFTVNAEGEMTSSFEMEAGGCD